MRIGKAARGRITGKFGATNVPGSHVTSHGGTDLGHGDMTPEDLALVAPADGVITALGWFGTYGNRIVINHGRDDDGILWESLIAHAKEWAPHLKLGDFVFARTALGIMGNTGGNWPVHCHQELRRNGVQVNPADYFVPWDQLNRKDDDVSFGDIIEHEGIKASAAVVIADTLRLSQDNGKRLEAIAKTLGELGTIKHRDINAPDDVVEADTLTAVYGIARVQESQNVALLALAEAIGALPLAIAKAITEAKS